MGWSGCEGCGPSRPCFPPPTQRSGPDRFPKWLQTFVWIRVFRVTLRPGRVYLFFLLTPPASFTEIRRPRFYSPQRTRTRGSKRQRRDRVNPVIITVHTAVCVQRIPDPVGNLSSPTAPPVCMRTKIELDRTPLRNAGCLQGIGTGKRCRGEPLANPTKGARSLSPAQLSPLFPDREASHTATANGPVVLNRFSYSRSSLGPRCANSHTNAGMTSEWGTSGSRALPAVGRFSAQPRQTRDSP